MKVEIFYGFSSESRKTKVDTMILTNAWNLLKIKSAQIFSSKCFQLPDMKIFHSNFFLLSQDLVHGKCVLYINSQSPETFLTSTSSYKQIPLTTDFCIHYLSHFFFLEFLTSPCFYMFFKVTTYFPSFAHALSLFLPVRFPAFILVFDA